jgi:hypothetical protein
MHDIAALAGGVRAGPCDRFADNNNTWRDCREKVLHRSRRKGRVEIFMSCAGVLGAIHGLRRECAELGRPNAWATARIGE